MDTRGKRIGLLTRQAALGRVAIDITGWAGLPDGSYSAQRE